MLKILQLMTLMIRDLDYTPEQIAIYFQDLSDGRFKVQDMMVSMSIVPWDPVETLMFYESLPKWRSALNVVCSRLDLPLPNLEVQKDS